MMPKKWYGQPLQTHKKIAICGSEFETRLVRVNFHSFEYSITKFVPEPVWIIAQFSTVHSKERIGIQFAK